MTDKIDNSIERILIDEEKIYCPYSVRKRKGKHKIVYSDHCVIIVEISIDVGKVKNNTEKSSKWSFTKEGYEDYQLESEASIQFDIAAESISQVYSSWVVEIEKLLAN